MQSKKRQDRNAQTWLAETKETKDTTKKRAYKYWLRFLKPQNEDWVLQNKTVEDWGQHLCDFRDFLSEQPKQRGEGHLGDNSTRTLTNTIRGYLRHIGCTVNLSKRQQTHLSKIESLERIDFPFNIRIKEKLLSVASPIEEYVVSCGVSFGLRIGDFLDLTRGQLEPLLEQDAPISIGKIQTKKMGEPAYPFISGDGKEAIKRLLHEMDSMGRTDPKEEMLRKDEKQTNKILQDLFAKANINLGSFVVRFHILRKFLTDNLASVSSGDKWKRIVGKSAKSPYIANECVEAYKRVMPLIDANGKQIRERELSHILQIIQKQNDKIVALEKVLKSHPIKIDASESHVVELEQKIADLEETLGRLMKILKEAGLELKDVSA